MYNINIISLQTIIWKLPDLFKSLLILPLVKLKIYDSASKRDILKRLLI